MKLVQQKHADILNFPPFDGQLTTVYWKYTLSSLLQMELCKYWPKYLCS